MENISYFVGIYVNFTIDIVPTSLYNAEKRKVEAKIKMIKTVTFFNTCKELCQLTGLSEEKLWDFGFDLDDWDWGFVSELPWNYGHSRFEKFVLQHMDSYCAGYKHVEYGGRHYYMLYHS